MRVPPAAAFAACTFIWGTTWIAIKIGYNGLDPIWGASLRFLLAGAILAPIMLAQGRGPPRVPRHVALVAFVGLVLFGLDYGMIYWAEVDLPSGLTAILFATLPLFVAAYGATLLPAERVTARQLGGIAVGLAGLVVIFADQIHLGARGLAPVVAIVTAASAAATSSVLVRRWGRDLAPIVLTQGAMVVGGVALWIASRVAGERQALPSTGDAWVALLYLVAFGSIVGFLLYWDLLKAWTANRSSLLLLLTPVVAVVTGAFAGERLTGAQWIGGAVVLAGVSLALVTPPSARAPAPAPAAPAK